MLQKNKVLINKINWISFIYLSASSSGGSVSNRNLKQKFTTYFGVASKVSKDTLFFPHPMWKNDLDDF